MAKITGYQMLIAFSTDDLGVVVMDWLNLEEGWTLHGDPFVAKDLGDPGDKSGGPAYHQAVVRYGADCQTG